MQARLEARHLTNGIPSEFTRVGITPAVPLSRVNRFVQHEGRWTLLADASISSALVATLTAAAASARRGPVCWKPVTS